MKVFSSLVTVLLVVLAGALAANGSAGRTLVGIMLPYAAFAVFLLGFCYRVVRWAWTPVPFRIPTTCGQERSLPWIKTNPLDDPFTTWGVIGRMALEVLTFRSLFRNNRAKMLCQRLVVAESKYLWLGSMAFHWAIVLLRHLRLLIEPVPAWVLALQRIDGFFQITTPDLYATDIILLGALVYLLVRRLRNPLIAYVSLFTDYFALFLLLAIALSGMLMRYVLRADVTGVKQFTLGLATFHPVVPQGLTPVVFVHVLLVSVLAAYFPFSKLMHMGGVFLSPTRNMANNNRAVRYINPWNYPVKIHTYAEWEEEFHDKIEAAGLPLEAEHAGTATAD